MSKQGIKVLAAAVITMLCLGSIYAWSIYVPYLMDDYGYSNLQTQLIFGSFIGIFTLSMVFGKGLLFKYGPKPLGIIAAVVYASGYFLAYFSGGVFALLFLGVAFLSGIATGFGYLISISVPVEWFPQKKGLIMGLVSGGFGAGAILESLIAQYFFKEGFNLLLIFLIIGITKGVLLLLASGFIKWPDIEISAEKPIPMARLVTNGPLVKLFIGIFTGTFAGLLIIGNLKHIGLQFPIDYPVLVLGITFFSIANFSGRLFWGWLNDYVSGRLLIPLSLFFVGLFSLGIGFLELTNTLYLLLSFLIGAAFGANFVIYANETARLFGLKNVGRYYPLVFLGYGISGIAGPFTGGVLHDVFGNYQYAALISSALAFAVLGGWLIFDRKRYNR